MRENRFIKGGIFVGWKETRVQDERLLLVLEFAAGERTRAEICRRYGVSRKTGYKW